MNRLGERKTYKRQIRQMAVISILFCIGMVIGSVLAFGTSQMHQSIWMVVREETISQLEQIQWQSYMLYLLCEKGKWYGMLLLFSVTIIAVPYIAGTVIYKGISMGFFFASLQSVFGWKGIVFVLATFFPQILIFLPVTIIYLLFLLQLHRDVKEYCSFPRGKFYIKYAALMLLSIILGCLLEAKINLLILKSAIMLLQ